MKLRTLALLSLTVAAVCIGAWPEISWAGDETVSSADLAVVDGGSGSWLPDVPPGAGETDVPGPVWVDVTGSDLWGVALRLHAQCGTPGGVVVTTWAASSSLVRTEAGAVDAGTPGCVSSGGTGWLLRVWIARDTTGSVVWEWKSDLVLHPSGVGCPTGSPEGVPCFFAVNVPSANPCPTTVPDGYPCGYALNEASMQPADITPVVDGIDTLRASVVLGVALVISLLAASLIIGFRRR